MVTVFFCHELLLAISGQLKNRQAFSLTNCPIASALLTHKINFFIEWPPEAIKSKLEDEPSNNKGRHNDERAILKYRDNNLNVMKRNVTTTTTTTTATIATSLATPMLTHHHCVQNWGSTRSSQIVVCDETRNPCIAKPTQHFIFHKKKIESS